MLINVLKETTSHLEGSCTMEEINNIRLFFTNKITRYKKENKKYDEKNSY